MDYEFAIKKIKDMENFGSKPGLERIKKLMDFIGNPQNKLKCIHVAGTNGKGSVCFALDAIFRAEGYKTGLYISPSISNFRERISINGKNIDEKSFSELFTFFDEYLTKKEFHDDPITEFELTTAMAFKFFADNNCDIAIIETGMGGKLDATNIIEKPVCSVLTSIALDHTQVLGNTIQKITAEKCGIIKHDCPVVVSDGQPENVYGIIKKVCLDNSSVFKRASISELKNKQVHSLNGISFNYRGEVMDTAVMGNHQFINLSCALKTIETIKDILPIHTGNIQKALKNLRIPCRLELVCKNPAIILDAAHNPQGTGTLADFLISNCKNKRIYAVVGMFKDKDYEKSLKNILKIFETVYTISPDNKRAETLDKITECAKKYCTNVIPCSSMGLAIETAVRSMASDDLLVVFGSFSVMKDFKNRNFRA